MTATIELHGVRSGLSTPVAHLFADGSSAVETGAGTSATEVSPTCYTFPNSGNLTGLHEIRLKDASGSVKDVKWAVFGTSGTIVAEDSRESALLPGQLASITGGGGSSGTYLQTFTIQNASGGAALIGAVVTASQNGILRGTSDNSDSSGHATMGLDAGQYDIVASCDGFNAYVGSLTVSGIASVPAIQLTAISVSVSAPGLVTGYLTALVDGVATQGLVFTRKLKKLPAGAAGSSFNSPKTATSNGAGLVEFVDHLPGAKYSIQCGDGPEFEYTAGSSTFAITDCYGS